MTGMWNVKITGPDADGLMCSTHPDSEFATPTPPDDGRVIYRCSKLPFVEPQYSVDTISEGCYQYCPDFPKWID
jgi:hypothetical protein